MFEIYFRKLAHSISNWTGTPAAFFLALSMLAIWGVLGPLLNFSETWQLSINTITTIITFLMVFLIQNTQNRESLSLHLKIDELLRAMKGTRTKLLDTEQMSDQELEDLHQGFTDIARRYKEAMDKRKEAQG